MIKGLFILLLWGMRWLFILAMVAAVFVLLIAIIALPFVLVAGVLRKLTPQPAPPPPAELYIAKETTMPAFLSVISYVLLVALMLGVALGWIGGL